MPRTIKASHYRENLFPHAELSKVVGKPTYTDILNLRREISANLASVPSTLGGGQFGHMGLALSDDTYKRLCSSTESYIRPTDPGRFSPNNLTGAELTTAKQDHDDLVQDFLEVNVLERTIINQLQAALDRNILLPKTNKISGLITCSIADLFDYLFRAYGNISALTLADARYQVTRHQYVHGDPMETVFDRIQDYANMAEAYGVAEPEVQLIEIGLIIIMNAIIFADDVGHWNALEPYLKTWENFQSHFIKAQTSYKKNRPTETAASLGYTIPQVQANAVVLSQPEQELAAANEYIAELEQVQAATHQANLVSTSLDPSTSSDNTIKQLLQKMNDLEAEMKAAKCPPAPSTASNNNKKKNKKKEMKDRKYCWTHGACAHTGAECNHPAEGHKKEASFQDMMGGSTKDCFWLPSSSSA